jgi:hypothetical protein
MSAGWRATLRASKDDALLAVDLYNQPGRPGRLEAFLVHMHLAWHRLFEAHYQRTKQPHHRCLPDGRYERVDGQRVPWDLPTFIAHEWSDTHPVRKNLELTMSLSGRVGQRHDETVAALIAGKAQALIANFENELTARFGPEHSLGDRLRFPLFVGAFSEHGSAQFAQLSMSAPKPVQTLIARFEATLEPTVLNDNRYDFRLHLVPHTGANTESLMALTYHREDELTEEERRALAVLGDRGAVIVREQVRTVANVDLLKATQVTRLVEERIPFRFRGTNAFARVWKANKVRPASGSAHPERTDERYCVYDKVHNDYLYTDAYVERLVDELSTEDGYRALVGADPIRKVAVLHYDRTVG